MSPDDVVVQRNNETLGSRAGSTSSSFGATVLTSGQWPRHRHNLPRQNYNLTNDVNVTNQPNHWGAVVNNPRCWDGRACMRYRVVSEEVERSRWITISMSILEVHGGVVIPTVLYLVTPVMVQETQVVQ